MKNLSVTILAAMLLLAVLTGCNPLALSGNAAGSFGPSNNGTSSLKLKINSYGTTINRSARSAWTTFIDESDAETTYDFYLYGEADSGRTTIAKQPVTVGTDGACNLNLAAKDWTLYLAAFPQGTAETDLPDNISGLFNTAHLIGTATALLSRYNGEVTFEMTTDKLTTPADVTTNIVLPESFDPSEWDVTAGLYTISPENEVATDDDFAYVTAVGAAPTGAFEVTDVPAGTYTLKATFEKAVGTGGTTTHVVLNARTTLLVIPGSHIYTDFVISEELIEEAPSAPETVAVTYVTGSEKDGKFTADISWLDTSRIEEFFELEIADITGIDGITSETADDDDYTADNTKVFSGLVDEAFYGKDGNLLASLNYALDAENAIVTNVSGVKLQKGSVRVTLDTGKIYAVRLRAATLLSEPSDWTYATVDGVTAPAGCAAFGGEYINRFTVTYDKKGGKIGTDTKARIDAYSYQGDTASFTALWAPTDLNWYNAPFAEWRLADASTAYTLPADGYKDYKNLYLEAIYETNGMITFFDPSLFELKSDYLTVYWEGTDASDEVTPASNRYVVSLSKNGDAIDTTGDKNKLFITIDNDSDIWEYESAWVQIDDSPRPPVAVVDGEVTLTVNCANLTKGKHTVTVYAKARNGNLTVSNKIFITIGE
ncbi:MAG: hypothetical protein MJ178_07905 [Treponemataceae bacterium]|nr:hypothetical protein [Treponemataceae bacterium]